MYHYKVKEAAKEKYYIKNAQGNVGYFFCTVNITNRKEAMNKVFINCILTEQPFKLGIVEGKYKPFIICKRVYNYV